MTRRERLDMVLDFIRRELMSGLPFPGVARIATNFGMTDTAIYAILDQLIIDGHITRTAGPSKHSRSKYTWALTKPPQLTVKPVKAPPINARKSHEITSRSVAR